MNAKQLLREHIQANAGGDRVPADDEDLFAAGFLDSMTFVKLLVFIQKRFGVSFERNELRFEKFRSINVIAEHVEKRTCP